MSKNLVRGATLGLLSLLGVLAPRAGRAVDLAVYAAPPSTEGVALSPDGTRLAYVHAEGDRRMILLVNVADRKIIHWVDVSAETPRRLDWADDDNLLITTSVTTTVSGFKEEWDSLRDYSLPRNQLRDLPGEVVGADETVKTVFGPVTVRYVGGHTVLFMASVSVSSPGLALFSCDLTDGSTRVVTVRPATGYVVPDATWVVDDRGDQEAESYYDEKTQHWSIAMFEGSTTRELAAGHAAVEGPRLLGYGPDGEALLIQSIEHGRKIWSLLSTKDGKFSRMPRSEVFDFPLFDRLSRLIGGINTAGGRQYVFLNPQWDRRWTYILKAFSGADVDFVSASADFSKVVVLVEGATYGSRYILVDFDKDQAFPVGKLYAGIDRPLEVRRITYAAGDGLQIPAHLTLPPNRRPRDLALVVLPDDLSGQINVQRFDWWSQALAEEGYAVLQPKYRGSGPSEESRRAGFGQWGRKMQTDLSDGVHYLVQQGIANPSKICIVGKGYGGYAALAGVTLQPTVYRCAVSVDGVSDLARLMRWEGRGGLDTSWSDRFLERSWGVSGSADPRTAAISPIEHVDSVKAPVLLMHGLNDSMFPYEQSREMYDALRAHNKQVRLVTLRQGDEELSDPETRLQVLEATVAFLQAHDPPN